MPPVRKPCIQACAAFILSGAALPSPARAADDAAGVEFFEKQVRPVLVERCFECHSAAKKIKGGLALDSRAGTLKGGDSGPALVPGKPEESRLIEAIRYKNQDLQMPPKKPLAAAELAALEKWVSLGAPDPRSEEPATAGHAPRVIDMAEGRKFWAFQPLGEAKEPAVKNSAWVKTPVDAFVLASLEEKDLSPAPPADKRTLIRRATFDLTGLPPTPEEVEDFLRDESPQAFDRVIERLLASPEYGERWGRHWLDVARYADSNGMDENVAYGHAWRYRDYVVSAFNNDKPYDRFLIEQIAGDLLTASDPGERNEQLTATGFLALGAKVLAEPDRRKLEMDIIDEQLDTLGKAFMGMTFGCARCHDHKFDPVTQGDYYALAAIFRSTKSLHDEKVGAIKFWNEHSLATPQQLADKAEYEKAVKAKQSEIKKFTNEARAQLKTELQQNAARYLAAAASLSMTADYSEVRKLAAKDELRPRYLLTCRQYLEKKKDHPVFAVWHELSKDGSEPVLAHYDPLFKEAMAASKAALAQARPAEKAPAATGDEPEPESDATAAKPGRPADPCLAAAYDALNDIAGFLAIPDKDEDAFDGATFARVKEMNDELMDLEDHTPDPPAIMGVADGEIVPSLPIHIRGSYLTLGKDMVRGFPEVMRASLTKPVMPAKQSGRLELARWMASGDHPLTARVMVNRLWRWHFGKGIVSSTDNFGILGDKPSHPALLDWMARYFVANGWAIKDMHRLLMKSSAYQMASSHPSAGGASSSADPAAVDPENRLLWRFNLQRLEAEELRDALLMLSGGLDHTIGGKTVPLRNREFVFNHTSRDHTTYESPRRALYLPIIRNHLYDMLEQFDYPDPTMPTGSRNATVVAPQSLILLNAPVVMDAAERFADRLLAESGAAGRPDLQPLISRVYELLYSRPPSTAERDRAAAFLSQYDDFHQGLALYSQALMAASEFLYLR